MVADMSVLLIAWGTSGNFGLARKMWLRQLEEIRGLPVYTYSAHGLP